MHALPLTQDTSSMVAPKPTRLGTRSSGAQVGVPLLPVGVGILDQAEPFQCSVKVPPPAPCARIQVPIAQQSTLLAQLMLRRPLRRPTPGLGTTDQRVPFQCSISGA